MFKFSKKEVINSIYTVIGCTISGIGVNVFLSPSKISTGGASGIGVILYNLFDIPVSLVVLLINIPLFIIALKTIGLKFSINAILGTLTFTAMIYLTKFLADISWFNFSGDLFLSSIFGGILMGLGMSLVFKGESSTRRFGFISTDYI